MNTQKLRDMNLGDVADELEALRKFKEAAEKQEPSCWIVEAPGSVIHNRFFAREIAEARAVEYAGQVRPLYADPIPADRPAISLDQYDAGRLNDYGGGNVGWWHDYIRAELERAYDFYQDQVS